MKRFHKARAEVHTRHANFGLEDDFNSCTIGELFADTHLARTIYSNQYGSFPLRNEHEHNRTTQLNTDKHMQERAWLRILGTNDNARSDVIKICACSGTCLPCSYEPVARTPSPETCHNLISTYR